MHCLKSFGLFPYLLLAAMLPLSFAFAQVPKMIFAGADSIQMMLIPAGEFMMGDTSEGDHYPPHKVALDSFYMCTYEITCGQYQRFCAETARTRLPEFWGMPQFHNGQDFPHHPVIGVSWKDADDFAKWIGCRLPTEAEFEYAARGGLAGRRYAWGDELNPDSANYKSDSTVVVGSYAPNAFGLYDMSGNVCEWVRDRYRDNYYTTSPERNPAGPETGRFRVIRGGGWHTGPGCVPVFQRNALPSNWQDVNVGFRCVKDVSEE